MTTKSWTNRPFPLPGGGTGVAVVPATIEQWSSDTGAQLQRITQGTHVQFPHPGDRAAYASVDPQPVDPNDGKMVRRDVTNGGGATVADVRSLPTDPDALAARLTRDGDVIHQAAIMLLTPLPTTELRQALYTVLARTPGSRLEQGVRDPDGRTGDGVHFVRGNDDTLLLFDTQTHELLGVRTVNDQRAALGRTLVGWDLVLDTHRAEEAPKADVEQRFPADSHGRLAPVYVPAG
jgi:hypothetical protein